MRRPSGRLTTRLIAAVMAVVTTVAGLILATTGPAAAIEVGNWVPYGSNNPVTTDSSGSTWVCGRSGNITTDGTVVGQACAIRSANRASVQVAVIVMNKRYSLYGTDAAAGMWDVQLGRLVERWECARSGVAARSWSVCFGRSRTMGWNVYAQGGANGSNLPASLGV